MYNTSFFFPPHFDGHCFLHSSIAAVKCSLSINNSKLWTALMINKAALQSWIPVSRKSHLNYSRNDHLYFAQKRKGLPSVNTGFIYLFWNVSLTCTENIRYNGVQWKSFVPVFVLRYTLWWPSSVCCPETDTSFCFHCHNKHHCLLYQGIYRGRKFL